MAECQLSSSIVCVGSATVSTSEPPVSLLQGDTGGPFNHRINTTLHRGPSTLGLYSQQSVDEEVPWPQVEGCGKKGCSRAGWQQGEDGREACSESPAREAL